MGLELRQQLKLSQQLVMTPQLQQAIKLLQLSRLELLETVQQELMENPFLDEAETETEIPEREELTESQAEEELVRTADWENYLGEFSSTSKQAASRDSEVPEEGVSFEARLASKPSLETGCALSILSSERTLCGDSSNGIANTKMTCSSGRSAAVKQGTRARAQTRRMFISSCMV